MAEFDWHHDEITRDTVVTGSFQYSENVQNFLLEECGPTFKSSRTFMNWVRDGRKKTMGQVADEWKRQRGVM